MTTSPLELLMTAKNFHGWGQCHLKDDIHRFVWSTEPILRDFEIFEKNKELLVNYFFQCIFVNFQDFVHKNTEMMTLLTMHSKLCLT